MAPDVSAKKIGMDIFRIAGQEIASPTRGARRCPGTRRAHRLQEFRE
jgi:hypothetical protein